MPVRPDFGACGAPPLLARGCALANADRPVELVALAAVQVGLRDEREPLAHELRVLDRRRFAVDRERAFDFLEILLERELECALRAAVRRGLPHPFARDAPRHGPVEHLALL